MHPSLRLVPISRSGSPDDPSLSLHPQAREVCESTGALYTRAGFELPWIGYLAVEEGRVVGTCAFKGPPRAGAVEIAYFTFPEFEGRGRATAMARELVAAARAAAPGVAIVAHTRPAAGASTRILEKLGFAWSGAQTDPDDGEVWEWRLEDGGAPPAHARPSSAPAGKSLKYARPERERRFLLASLPAAEVARSARILDLYLTGTRLRLRRSEETAGGRTEVHYKLTQKVPGPDGTAAALTTIYLDREEYDVLATLPARRLSKTRHFIAPYAVDVFEPPLHGLVLAEIDLEGESEGEPPPFALAEVTRDLRFTGGRLAAASREELVALLGEFGLK